jgi:predicted O-methyltransferase YrrM
MKKQKISENPGLKECTGNIPLLSDIRKNAVLNKIPVISDEAGNFIKLYCILKKPVSVLEIGCGIGYSTFYILSGLACSNKKTSYCGIDLNRQRLGQAEDLINRHFGKHISEKMPGISFFAANALKFLRETDLKFDFVFIDGAKFEYPDYLELAVPRLKKNAAVIADNIFYSGKVFKDYISKHDYNSVRGIRLYIERVTKKGDFDTVFFSMGDGMSLSFYKGSLREASEIK